GDAHAHAPDDRRAGVPLPRLERWAELVPEGFNLPHPLIERKLGARRELDGADRRIDDDAGSPTPPKHLLHQPDAGGAMHALNVEYDTTEAALPVQSLDDGLEPLVIDSTANDGVPLP